MRAGVHIRSQREGDRHSSGRTRPQTGVPGIVPHEPRNLFAPIPNTTEGKGRSWDIDTGLKRRRKEVNIFTFVGQRMKNFFRVPS